jgi:hypothetical protein
MGMQGNFGKILFTSIPLDIKILADVRPVSRWSSVDLFEYQVEDHENHCVMNM